MSRVFSSGRLVAAAIAIILLAGCGKPNRANIELRKKNQGLEGQVEAMKGEVEAQRARVAGLEERIGTLPTLPQERLDLLFTAHGFQLGRLTQAGEGGMKVYLTPVDERRLPLKATGQVTVEAYELSENARRLGQWVFEPAQVKERWREFGPLNAFVLECPWQERPSEGKLTLKVTFRDELTGRVFSEVRQIDVTLPPASSESRL